MYLKTRHDIEYKQISLLLVPLGLWLVLWFNVGSGGFTFDVSDPSVSIQYLYKLRSPFLVFVLLASSLMLVYKFIKGSRPDFTVLNPLALLTVYGLIGLVASVLSPDFSLALFWASLYLSGPLVLYANVSGQNEIIHLKNIMLLNWSILIIVGLIFLVIALIKLNLWEAVINPSLLLDCPGDGWYNLSGGRIRETGVGRYAAIGCILVLSGLWQPRLRYFCILLCPALFLLMLWTGARGSFLGFAAGVPFVLFAYIKKWIIMAGMGVFALALVLVWNTDGMSMFMSECIFRGYVDLNKTSQLNTPTNVIDDQIAEPQQSERADLGDLLETLPESTSSDGSGDREFSQYSATFAGALDNTRLSNSEPMGPSETSVEVLEKEIQGSLSVSTSSGSSYDMPKTQNSSDSIPSIGSDRYSDVDVKLPPSDRGDFPNVTAVGSGIEANQTSINNRSGKRESYRTAAKTGNADNTGSQRINNDIRTKHGSSIERDDNSNGSYSDETSMAVQGEVGILAQKSDAFPERGGELNQTSINSVSDGSESDQSSPETGNTDNPDSQTIINKPKDKFRNSIENDGNSQRSYSDDTRMDVPGDVGTTVQKPAALTDIQNGKDSFISRFKARRDTLLSNNFQHSGLVDFQSIFAQEGFFSFTGRTSTWAKALALVEISPWMGHGFHADRLLINQHAHNSLVHALLQTGLLGTICFIAGIVAAWIALARNLLRLGVFGESHRHLIIQCGGVLAYLTTRTFPESTGAFFGVDWLILAPILLYLGLVQRYRMDQQSEME